MSTSNPEPPFVTQPESIDGITTQSFKGIVFPAQVANRIINLMLAGGSPFARSLHRQPTNRRSFAYPIAKASDEAAWVGELQKLPVAALDTDAVVVAVCKLAQIIALSNESVRDATVNLDNEVGRLLADSAGPVLDAGLLYGTGGLQPAGVVAIAETVNGSDLATALTEAIGSTGDQGGTINTIAALPSVFAQARNERGADGTRLYPQGVGAEFGVREVGVPTMHPGDILAYDADRVDLIVRDDLRIDTSADRLFEYDAVAVRLRGRFAVAAPEPDRSLRKLVVGDGDGGDTGDAEPLTASAKRAKSA